MTGAVTWEVLTWLIAGIVGILGLTFGAFWKIWSLIEQVKEDMNEKLSDTEDKLDEAIASLAEHKLHSAQTYVTQAGMEKQTEQLMFAINRCAQGIEALGNTLGKRIDILFQSLPASRRSRGSSE
ncbi:hypothetical protein G6M50_05945 [Agrobacterium rhizogenes]|nr:hypothetical protein [Rhizobium rhizogenes]NTJ77344.1 hypothetical protein [Rhizobium rhizogenes]